MDELEELRQSFRESLEERRQVLLDLRKKLDGNGPSGEVYREVHHHIHKLAGSASLYGFQEIGALSQELDLFLFPYREDFSQLTAEAQAEVQEKVTRLVSMIDALD